MTDHHTVSVALTEHGTHGRVYIDGTELQGIRGLDLKARVGNVATLELDLITYEAEVDGDLRVIVPEETRQTLVVLGWTPPTAEATKAGESK